MNINVIDPAEFVIKETLRRFDVSGSGTTRFVLSKDSSVFRKRASEYLGVPAEIVVEL
jgi:hypothetical protein